MQEAMINKAKQLLADGTVDRVIGWKRGEFVYDITPAVFETVEELESDFVYDDFTSANVSKYLVKESRKEGRILAFLKPCDTYSFNQLIKEHRVLRENVYIIGIPGGPKLDIEKIKAKVHPSEECGEMPQGATGSVVSCDNTDGVAGTLANVENVTPYCLRHRSQRGGVGVSEPSAGSSEVQANAHHLRNGGRQGHRRRYPAAAQAG